MNDRARCGSCGREIMWVKSPAGANLPLDARPMTAYTLDAVGPPVTVVRAHPDEVLYVSHFATCPSADTHSRQRGRTA